MLIMYIIFFRSRMKIEVAAIGLWAASALALPVFNSCSYVHFILGLSYLIAYF